MAVPSAESSLTPVALEVALARLRGRDDPAAANALAGRVRDWFGTEELPLGPAPRIEECTVAWALDVPESAAGIGTAEDDTGELRVRVLADDSSFVLPLQRLGATTLFAGVAALTSGTAFRWNYEVSRGPGHRRLLPDISRRQLAAWRNTPSATGWRELLPDLIDQHILRQHGWGQPLEVYATHPESRPRPDVPHSQLHERPNWQSRIFEGTTRDWWFSVPAQCASGEPACVMVFHDGAGPKDYVPTVFDNLMAQGDMPVTVGVYINPGIFADGTRNRSFEYDTLSDQYVRFLLEEILPEVERTVPLRHDATSRAISGGSSGGICSFTAAWERPDAFSKVLSWIGSFTDIRGGHNYPPMIRKTPRKPIRVFLQDGANDLNVPAGDWWLANQEMASALAFAGYDFATVWGKGFHSGLHGRAILPDSLRWLWRGWNLTGEDASQARARNVSDSR